MLFYKQLDSESIQKNISQISSYIKEILMSQSSKISYQIAYDKVYQICRNQKQQKLLQTIEQTLRKQLPQIFKSINYQSINMLVQTNEVIKKISKNIQIINNICLYLDINYCKRDLGIKLINKLNQILLQQFFKNQQLLQHYGKNIAQFHIKNQYQDIQLVLSTFKTIDAEDQYFINYFVKYYLPILIKHYSTQAQQRFNLYNQSKQIQYYIKYATDKLEKQTNFLNKYWPDKKCQPNKSFIIKQLYQILVTKYKQSIYQNHKVKLFNQLTLQILQLFKYQPKSNDIQKHADWYNIQIKQKLSTLSYDNNTQFIINICDFYKKIMILLQTTYLKFDIHYRSRFAFQQWINTQKLQMPLRLNQFIKQFCLSNQPVESQTSTNTVQKISIIFVLMKQKNVFEKYYRRQLINRILTHFNSYNLSKEIKIIELMEKQCSQQFVKNIMPIVQSYNKKQKIQSNMTLSTFLLNTQNWPYQQKNTSISINQELVKLTQKQTQSFAQNNKDKSIYWHPIIGVVKLSISFLTSKWKGQIIVNTCMANVLLYFVKTAYKSFQIKNFCCQTGYKLDQIYDSVRKLIHVKILINEGTQQNYKLSLNQQFSHSSQYFDVLNVEAANKFQAKPLEQLKADRKFMVEAIIVKIMKRLKHTDKQTILKEASPLIQKRGFNFNAKFVQSAIERLVDKQFIRDYQDGKYGYIA